MRWKKLLVVLLCLAAAGLLRAGDAAPAVTPGSRILLEFPEFGEANHGGNMRLEAFVPEDWTPDRAFPLLVWLGGGPGSHEPDTAMGITARKGFICVGLSYRKDTVEEQPEPLKGAWKTPWAVYKVMLQKLDLAIPNIDPRRRICGGFSSGGAGVSYLVGASDPGFSTYFCAFMPGGYPVGMLSRIKGKPMLLFEGDKDKQGNPRDPGVFKTAVEMARTAGVDAELLVFKGYGHEMPGEYMPAMREWLVKVLRRDLPALADAMGASIKAKSWQAAVATAREIILYGESGSAPMTAAENALVLAGQASDQAAAKLLAKPTDLRGMLAWLREWKGWPQTAAIITACDPLARTELARLQEAKIADRVTLHRLIEEWKDLPVQAEVITAFDLLAAADLATAKFSDVATARIGELERFIKTWDVGATCDKARGMLTEAREAAAPAELEAIAKVKDPALRLRRLNAFQLKYGTTAAALGQEQRETAAAEILVGVQALSNRAQRKKALAELSSLAEGTKAGREAAALLQKEW